jgi:excinuclease ABC subunit A
MQVKFGSQDHRLPISIRGASEHNLKHVDVDFPDGVTVVTGVSGSGKSSLVFDTLFRESERYFAEMFIGGRAPTRAPAAVDSIRGLSPTVAIGQDLLNRNPNSSVATFSGVHPFIRLLFSRFGQRSCAACDTPSVFLQEEDIVTRLCAAQGDVSARLVHQVPGSHRRLITELKQVFGSARIRVDGKGTRARMKPDQRHDISVLFASPDGDLMAARQLLRELRGLGIGTIEVNSQTISINPVCSHCDAWLPPLEAIHFKTACSHCEGKGCKACRHTGLHPVASTVRWQGYNLHDLLECSVDQVKALLDNDSWDDGGQDISPRLRQEMTTRLEAMQRTGLGYLQLSRSAPSLSRGEGQRIRLAVALVSRLEGVLHILDEPTIGLHAADVNRFMPAFGSLPGPVIYVEHDRHAAAQADYCVDIGPDAGPAGGEVAYTGTPAGLWQSDTLTGRYFSLRERVDLPDHREPADTFLEITGAMLNNLQQIDVSFALGRLNVVSGVSGSGKTTLISRVLVASFEQEKAIGCQRISGLGIAPVMVDQSPIGKNPRSNPATYTKLANTIRDVFASATDLSASHYTFNRPEGACPQCEGMGAIEVKMRYLPSNWMDCSACKGQRFSDEVLKRKVSFGENALSIADFLAQSVDQAIDCMMSLQPISKAKRDGALRILRALADTGLGYLSLGQASPSLSGGEAQRVKLARYLGSRNLKDKLLVLDEPTTGLHPRDVAGLMVVMDRLVREGATIVVIEHNLDMICAADWVVDLGPGSGPAGGLVLYQGDVAGLRKHKTSLTAQALRDEGQLVPQSATPTATGEVGNISIRGAATHNLKSIDVDIPKGKFTVVTGVSGSGKSSLVRDVLEVEARRRYLESLSMYERQGVSEGAAGHVGSISGLGVTLPLANQRRFRNPRLTVGTATDLTYLLAALLSQLGEKTCEQCDNLLSRNNQRWHCAACDTQSAVPEPRHFIANIYGSACLTCQGMGSLRDPKIEKLIIAPDKPLCAGAMYSPGFFPQGYYGKPFNGGYDELQVLARKHDFDPFETPWQDMTAAAQQAFLFGGDPMLVTYRNRKGGTRQQMQRFHGVFSILGAWDQGGTYTEARLCPECLGGRLRPEYLAVTLAEFNMHDFCSMPLSDLFHVFSTLHNSLHKTGAPPALSRLLSRLELLCHIGLNYIHLDRRTATLSAGEAQRMALVNVIASGLTGLTVLLDEPSRGMHPREVDALLEVLKKITGTGNTTVVVEHDPDIMLAADHIIDLGPGAGAEGGRVIGAGAPEVISKAQTPTGLALTGRVISVTKSTFEPQRWLSIFGARENNLSIAEVGIPLGGLVGVCGVSGSGKSTLVIDTLARYVAPKKYTTSVATEAVEPGDHDRITGAPSRCIQIDQSREGIASPLGFLGLMSPIARRYAASGDAVALGLTEKMLVTPCASCRGSGETRTDMGFLPDEHERCEVCGGSGFHEEIRQVAVNGLTLPELVSMTVSEVLEIWREDERVTRILQLLEDIGLGYLVLKQTARSLSGGEVQRLKIARELSRKTNPDTLFLLDEPGNGLHLSDVAKLMTVLKVLVNRGHSVVVVEHHLDILAQCDWLIELGPVGGPKGGRIIGEGTPHALAQLDTPTAPYLRALLQ